MSSLALVLAQNLTAKPTSASQLTLSPQTPSPDMASAEIKNIVVIGLGQAAIGAARGLEKGLPATHRIVIIVESDAGYYPPGSVRAAIVPGWEDKVAAPALSFFDKGSRHVVLAKTKVTEIGDDFVKVDTVHDGFEDTIKFDYAVIATGSVYGNAFQPDKSLSLAEISSSFVASQAAIKAANSILIVGAGPTGIELSGEIVALHSDKKITLVGAETTLTPRTGKFSAKLGKQLEDQIRAKKINLHLGAKLDLGGKKTGPIGDSTFILPDGAKIDADFLIVAFGSSPRSDIVKAFDPSAVDGSGRVKIGPYMQVEGHDSLFAIGDVCNSNEGKTAIAAQNHGPIVAANILALVAGKKPVKAWSAALNMIMISFGPNGGAGQLPLPIFNSSGPWLTKTIKSAGLFIDMWRGSIVRQQ